MFEISELYLILIQEATHSPSMKTTQRLDINQNCYITMIAP